MGGGPDTVDPTAQEIESARIAAEQWDQYQEYGVPIENEYIRQTTGYVMNAETGEYEVDPHSDILNPDGTVRVDTSAVDTANEAAYTRAIGSVNPNRLEQAESINREGAVAGAQGAGGEALGQQRNHRQSLLNAVAIGQGQEAEALAHNAQITQQAQQDQIQSASNSAQDSATNAYIAGNLAGLGASRLNRSQSQSALDTLPTPNPHTR